MPILISSSSFDDHFRTKSIQFSHLPHILVIYNSNSFVTPPAYITAKAISFLAIIFVKFSFKFVPYLYSCDLWLVISLFLQPFFNYFFTFRSTSHAHTSTPPHAQKHRQIHTHTHTHPHTHYHAYSCKTVSSSSDKRNVYIHNKARSYWLPLWDHCSQEFLLSVVCQNPPP